jgi:hypothetical protein
MLSTLKHQAARICLPTATPVGCQLHSVRCNNIARSPCWAWNLLCSLHICRSSLGPLQPCCVGSCQPPMLNPERWKCSAADTENHTAPIGAVWFWLASHAPDKQCLCCRTPQPPHPVMTSLACFHISWCLQQPRCSENTHPSCACEPAGFHKRPLGRDGGACRAH